MSLIQLIYVSSAEDEFREAELNEILASSARHNTEGGITGLLLYSKGSFMQVLEGEERLVNETYARICIDPRHHNLLVLAREPIARREFETWSMGFRRLTKADAERLPGFAPLFSDGFRAADIGAKPGLALELLKQFSTT